MKLKMAVFAPMPMVSVTTASVVNMGSCSSRRRTCLRRIVLQTIRKG